MRFFFFVLFFFVSFCQYFSWTSATESDVRIISRAEWGADETLRFMDHPLWQTRYAAYLNYLQSSKTATQLEALTLSDARIEFLKNTGGASTHIVREVYREGGHMLRWPRQYTEQVSRIIIHHEGAPLKDGQSDEEAIRNIYKYHTLNNEWGDIAYHYIIGQRGKIYEGRSGGDYVAGTHALYNNLGTVGIVILGEYDHYSLNRDQIASIEKLIPWVARKYGITLTDTVTGAECTSPACTTLRSVKTPALIGHQDVRVTDCPGSQVYPLIAEWRTRLNQVYTPVLNPVPVSLEPIPPERTMNHTLQVVDIASKIKSLAIGITSMKIPTTRYVGPKIRIKLSYPNTDTITLSSADTRTGSLIIDNKKIPIKSNQSVTVGIVGQNRLSIKTMSGEYIGGSVKFSHSIVRIDSWSRIPDWDKNKTYNDNLFRDTIRIVGDGGKLTVINDLPLEWYLKGLGEVSNTDLPEKIKTITIAARSYASYYMSPKNRKFPGVTLYDGSDDPDVFQKYLGYGYESRSSNVSRIVDGSRGMIIRFDGKPIKPWYFSSSDGKTLSYREYCEKNTGKTCEDISYLQSVDDPAGVGKTRSGHGVGISGVGATYWATQGWKAEQIIAYYLKGVTVGKR